jgi:uncharacterized membrane protein HdeD (DUF308 family)
MDERMDGRTEPVAMSAWDLMTAELADRWWVFAIRGLAGILLGIAAFAWPGITLFVLVILFGAYLLVDSVLAVVAGGMSRSWLLVLEGAAGVIAGVLTLVWPSITALVLLVLVAIWAILTGLIELYAAIRLRRVIKNEWVLILVGAASVIFGILLLINPAAGLLTLVWLIGAYSLVFGVLLVALAFRLRSSRDASRAVPSTG